MEFTNHYVNDIDLLFIKFCLEKTYRINETKISVDMLQDVLAKVLFQIMIRSMAEKNSFIPSVDLIPLFEDTDRLEKLSRFDHSIKITTMESLLQDFRDIEQVSEFKEVEGTIIEKYNRDQLKRIASTLSIDIENSTKSAKKLLSEYGYRIDTLLDKTAESRMVLTSMDLLNNELAHLAKPEEEAYPTTGSIIDLVNEGINAPSLIFFLAAPKHNKSTCLYNSCIHSLKLGRTCVFATIEINAEETSRKLLSIYTGIPFSAINKRNMTREQKEIYIEKIKEFQVLTEDRLFIMDDKEGMSSKDIGVYCKHLERAGIFVQDLFIDYLMLLTPNDPKMSRIEALTVSSQDLRKLSQQLNVRLFTAQQLHSSANQKDFNDVDYDDVYFIKSLAQDCTYSIVNRHIKDDDGNGRLMQRFLASRQAWDEKVYWYPEYNAATFYLGAPEVYDEDNPVKTTQTDYTDKELEELAKNIIWEEK